MLAVQVQPEVIQHSNMPSELIGQFPLTHVTLPTHVTCPYKWKQIELLNQIPPRPKIVNIE